MFEIFNATTANRIATRKNKKLQKENVQLCMRILKRAIYAGKPSETITFRTGTPTLNSVVDILRKKGYQYAIDENKIEDTIILKVWWYNNDCTV